jgi:PAS domain-containing protein
MTQPEPDSSALIAGLPAALINVANDEHYTLRFANKQAAELLGYSIEDFLNNAKYTAASVVHPDDLDLLEHADDFYATGGKTLVLRYRLISATGEEVLVLDVSRPQLDADGNPVGFITLLIDLRDAPDLQGPSKILSRVE